MAERLYTRSELAALLRDAMNEALVTMHVAGIAAPVWFVGYRSAVGYIATRLEFEPPTQEKTRRELRAR